MGNLLGKVVAVLLATALLAIHFPQNAEGPKGEAVLFAVWGPREVTPPRDLVLDPIARIKGAVFADPLLEEKDREAASSNFEKTYFVPGKTYSLLFGGSEFGSITVEKAEVVGCEGQTATAKASKSTPLGLDALAVTTLGGIRTHENWRHVASDEQRSMFIRLASDYLKEHGAETSTPEKIKIPSLRATRLKRDGPDTLIGNVILEEKTKIHDLFLVVEVQLEKAQPIIASYHVSNDPEDRTDRQQERFLDQVDLNADGTDEIVTMSGYYESWDYAIYQEQNGEWKLAYKGGGGGC